MSQIGRQLVQFLQGRLFKRGMEGGASVGAPYDFRKPVGARRFAVDEVPGRGVRETTIPGRPSVRTSPGQLELPITLPRGPQSPAPKPQFETRGVQLTPDEAALLKSDPGTFRSLQGLADRANTQLGLKPGTVTPQTFLQPNWSEQLRAYEKGTGMIPPGTTSGLAGRPGSLVRSPGGEVVDSRILEAAIRDVTPGAAQIPMGPESRAAIEAGMRGGAEVPVDVAFRNATGGIQQMDLGSLLNKAGLGAAGIGAAAGSTALMNAFRPQGQTPMGQPTATPEAGPLTPAVTGIEGSVEIPSPIGALQGMVPGGMGTSVARTQQSDLIEALANARAAMKLPSMPGAPATYPSIGEYYGQREAYTNLPSVAKAVTQELGQQAPRYAEKDIQTWAYSNPELAFELLEGLKGNRPMPSQQMPQMRGVELSTPMGTNFMNNALGSSQYSVEQLYGTQGASDINATVTPQFVETLQPLPPNYAKAISRASIPVRY